MTEAASNSEYVNTMNYFIDYYENYNAQIKDFDFGNLFDNNEIQNQYCFVKVTVDPSLALYFIKEGLTDIPIGVERFYDDWARYMGVNMASETQQIVQELTEDKTDLTHLYERDRIQQDSGWDNYYRNIPVEDSWGPPPLAGVVRSQPTIQYDTPEEAMISPVDVNRQLNFDTDDMISQIIDEIHSINSIRCPLCRTENTKDKCVNIKGSGDTCSICLDKRVEIFFIGCGHAVTCRSCFEQL